MDKVTKSYNKVTKVLESLSVKETNEDLLALQVFTNQFAEEAQFYSVLWARFTEAAHLQEDHY